MSLRFYILTVLIAVMGAGVLLISILTQQLGQKFYLVEKEDQSAFFVSAVQKEFPELLRPVVIPEQKKKEIAQKSLSRFYDPLFMQGMSVLNSAMQVLASSYSSPMQKRRLVEFAKNNMKIDSPRAALIHRNDALMVRVIAPAGKVGPQLFFVIDYKVGQFSRLLLFSNILIFGYALIYAIISALIGIVLIDRMVLRPISVLLSATETIASGEYPDLSGLGVNARGEIAELVSRFDAMIERLKEKESDLNRRIQELEDLNAKLTKAQNTLMRTEKMASLGQLAAGLSHEIGNPLAAIQGYVEIIESEKGNAAVLDEFLPEIQKEIERINRIVRGLLTYARPQEGETSKFDIAELITNTVELISPQPVFKHVSITTDLRYGLVVEANFYAMQQAIVNLLLNASQAMESEGEIRIAVREIGEADNSLKERYANKLDPQTDYVLITIEDSGPGIPPDILNKIFDPFFTTKPVGKGTGLGLALVQKVVEENGGIIDVESAPDSGAIFFIILPIAERVSQTVEQLASESMNDEDVG